jgi:phosphopantothenoylcysteine decarboxylase/phosphopantothenate--cysteine ligase
MSFPLLLYSTCPPFIAKGSGMLKDKRILLIIGGGIAAFKALELIRRLRDQCASVRGVLTDGGAQFITPLSVAALTEQPVHTSLFDLKDETEMGHIQLSRQADLILVCPATADLMAKMAAGLAGDLASTLLLATDKPVMIVPAMNVRMWQHPATQRNLATLRADGIHILGPVEGAMACGEFGPGRMVDVPEIVAAVGAFFAAPRPLAGRHALVTAGPTHEPIDPVRYIANRSSGKQGYALAGALAALGARVTLVSGPTSLTTPAGVTRIDVETARQMADAVEAALPADVAVCVAAVADWRVEETGAKIKKGAGSPPSLSLIENPDILAGLAQRANGSRPALVVGFAAETDAVLDHAIAKRARKGADWIIANDVSPATGIMGGDANAIHLITAQGVETWPAAPKAEVAARLAQRIADDLTR